MSTLELSTKKEDLKKVQTATRSPLQGAEGASPISGGAALMDALVIEKDGEKSFIRTGEIQGE